MLIFQNLNKYLIIYKWHFFLSLIYFIRTFFSILVNLISKILKEFFKETRFCCIIHFLCEGVNEYCNSACNLDILAWIIERSWVYKNCVCWNSFAQAVISLSIWDFFHCFSLFRLILNKSNYIILVIISFLRTICPSYLRKTTFSIIIAIIHILNV